METMSKPIEPEIYEPDESLPRDLVALRRFARLMDEAVEIPGTNKRIGLDAAVGLIPGFGDALGALFSLTIVLAAIRHRVRFGVLGKMVTKILVDLMVGTIPVLGDVFDFLFKENVANIELLIRHRDRTKPPRGLREAGLAAAVGITVLLVLFAILSIAIVYIGVLALRSR